MSNEDDVREKQQKLAEIKGIMAQFQEKLNSTTRELEEAKNQSSKYQAEINDINKNLDASNATNSELEKQLLDANAIIAELKTRIKELEDLLSQKDREIQQLKETNMVKDIIPKQQAVQKEQIKKEIREPQPQETIVEIISGERIICPDCGAKGIDIKTLENRDKILDYLDHKPIYAKKFICRKCGREF